MKYVRFWDYSRAYSLWSLDYSAHSLALFCSVFWKKLLQLVCFVVSRCVTFIWICCGSNYLCKFININFYKIAEDQSVACRPNEECPHVALHFCNDSQIERFYMKPLIVDRLTETSFICLWNTLGCF